MQYMDERFGSFTSIAIMRSQEAIHLVQHSSES